MEKLKELNFEKEKESKISLHFFRHSIKENDKSKTNNDQLLTPEGRKLSKERSFKGVNLDQAVAFGNLRPRTHETALLMMAGQEDEITGEESLEELKNKLGKSNGYGGKIGIDPRLDYINNGTELFNREIEAFLKKEFLKFMIEESDRIAVELGDKETDTCNRLASKVGQVVKKYLSIAPRWQKLVNDDSKNYSEKLERFFGSSQGVTESFLARVIEKSKGVKERDSFVRSLDNQGFDFTEGFEMEIINKGASAPAIKVFFQKKKDDQVVFSFNEIISQKILDEIIEEGLIK